MAIGPDASREASGRLVVIAGFYGALGTAAIVAGLGPIVRPADLGTRAVAVVGLTGGATLLVGAVGLLVRRRWSRRVAILGGYAATAVGLITTILALDALASCPMMPTPQDCTTIIIGLALAGLAISGCGIGSIAVVRRARPGFLLRRRP